MKKTLSAALAMLTIFSMLSFFARETPSTVLSSYKTAVYFNLNPNPAVVGETVTLRGIIVDEFSQPLSNETVKLYARLLAGSWKYITSLTTNDNGMFMWQATIPVTGKFIFAVYYPGSEVYESTYNFAVLIVQLPSEH